MLAKRTLFSLELTDQQRVNYDVAIIGADAKEKVLLSHPPVTLAKCATVACSRRMRSQPRGGTPQKAHAYNRYHSSIIATPIPCTFWRVFYAPPGVARVE